MKKYNCLVKVEDKKRKFRQANLLMVTILFSLLISSCDFNKLYLKPFKAPLNASKIRLVTHRDTTIIFFEKGNHQPTFTNNGKDTLSFNYTIESVVFKSANGNLLNGWMLKPKGITPKITILHFHGNSGFIIDEYLAITPLLKDSFQIFTFDYSGFGFSTGNSTKNNILVDGLSALEYVKKREDVLPTKLIIYGQSLGGHLAAVVAGKSLGQIDGLILEGAFSSHKDIAAYTVPVLGRLLVKQNYSALKSIKKYNNPLLIIHSTEDKTIPLYMSKKLFSSANTPKEFYQIDKCHICGPMYYSDKIATKIKTMLQ